MTKRRDMRPIHVITEEHRDLERFAGALAILRDADAKGLTVHVGLEASCEAALVQPTPFNSSAPMTEPVPEGDIVIIEINQEQPEPKVETTETTETETETTEKVTEKPADEDEDDE